LTHYSDLLNLDIKVPGEHQILNETFDAEIQMLHIHMTVSRMAQIGVPVRATADGYNDRFQAVLDQFQAKYEMNRAACAATNNNNKNSRRGRRRREMAVADNAVLDSAAPIQGDKHGFQRQLQNNTSSNVTTLSSNGFDLYADFLPTVYFYRYEGSNTEPPCMSMTWFVMNHPLIISFAQLRQVKHLIFTNVHNETCQPTSVHNLDQSVARPIQPLGMIVDDNDPSGQVLVERPVMMCKDGSFLPDDR
jgi:carbonic anhydrase